MREKIKNRITDVSNTEIDPWTLAYGMVRRCWIIFLALVIGGGAGYLIANFGITPMYESTTQVYIIASSGENTVTYNDLQVANQLASDYAQILTSENVLNDVIETLGLNETVSSLRENVTISQPSDGRIIEISVQDTNRILAQAIADQLRDSASAQLESITNTEMVNIIDYANLPTSPCSPNLTMWTIYGACIGGVLAALVLFLVLLPGSFRQEDEEEGGGILSGI